MKNWSKQNLETTITVLLSFYFLLFNPSPPQDLRLFFLCFTKTKLTMQQKIFVFNVENAMLKCRRINSFLSLEYKWYII